MIVYKSLRWAAAVPDEMDGSHWSMNKWCCVIDKRSYTAADWLIEYMYIALRHSVGLKNAVKLGV